MDATDKKIALDALFYEVWMLNRTFHLLSCSHIHPTFLVEENANLESFLIHVRNIVYFLEDGQCLGDIRCSDFGIAGIKVNLPVGNGIREINKYLSHLTKERILVPKPRWECEKIKEEINRKIEQFITNLDQSIFPTNEGMTKNSFMEILRKI